MVTLNLDKPTEVLEYLSEPIKRVYEGLDYGLSLAEAKMADVEKDLWLYAHWIRSGACWYLKGLKQEDWKLGRDLPNSGIEVVCGPIVFRVLKAHDGSAPPHPGRNSSRRDFYSQQLRLPLIIDGVALPSGANLLLDWTVGENEQILLALSKPINTWEFCGQPQLEWRRHVVVKPGEHLRFVPSDEDIPVQPKIELDEEDGVG